MVFYKDIELHGKYNVKIESGEIVSVIITEKAKRYGDYIIRYTYIAREINGNKSGFMFCPNGVFYDVCAVPVAEDAAPSNEYYILTHQLEKEPQTGQFVWTVGEFDSVWKTEAQAYRRACEIESESLGKISGYLCVCGNKERFVIIETNDPDIRYHIVDAATQTKCTGACSTLDDAIEGKRWDEQHHWLL